MAMEQTLSVMEFEQDISAVEDFVELPKGVYIGTIMSVESRISNAGNDYYNLIWVIPTTQFPADYDVQNYPEGAQVYQSLMRATPGDRKSITKIKQFMATINVPIAGSVIDPSQWIGMTAVLNVQPDETINGNSRIRLNSVEKAEA